MARQPLAERISKRGFGHLILDGAMGTEIMNRGVKVDICGEMLNIDSAQTIAEIHTAYFDAGSEAVITNTFGANEIILARHSLDSKAEAINFAAAENARKAAGQDRYVLGGFGPTGDFLEPLGNLKPEPLKQAFANQAKSLCAGGVDGFIIETMSAVDEVAIAIEAIKSVCDLPIMVSFAYDPAGGDFKTMMGIGASVVVKKIVPLGIAAIGFNCGTLSMDEYVSLTQQYASAVAGSDIAIMAEPNAGRPELVGDKAVYKLTPEVYADYAKKIVDAGATIIGGCCGTTPAHIKAISDKLGSC